MTSLLADKTCTPCRGGVPPLTVEEAEAYHVQAPEWVLRDEATRIERTYRFAAHQEGQRSARKRFHHGGKARPHRGRDDAGRQRLTGPGSPAHIGPAENPLKSQLHRAERSHSFPNGWMRNLKPREGRIAQLHHARELDGPGRSKG